MTRLSRYELIERLGRGGMGEVWLARIDGPGGFMRLLVVKRILATQADNPRFISRFMDEARLSARLHHPNIVQVFEFGEAEGEHFLAMEYLHGSDLDALLQLHARRGPPDPGLAALVGFEVARALAYAHRLAGDDGRPLGLVHRDVSPSNILLGYEGAVKLADFGLARALAESPSDFTHTGLKGKLGYVSPEMARGVRPDHRADQWALGVVMYEALTARRLFVGQPVEVLALITAADVDPPSRLNPAVPAQLDRICLRALSRDPEQRFPSCDDLAHELERMVHELRWSGARLSAMLHDLMPPRPRAGALQPISPEEMAWVIETTAAASPKPVPPPAPVEAAPQTPIAPPSAPRPRRRALWLPVAGALLLAASTLYWWLHRTLPVPPPPPLAEVPPPASPPPLQPQPEPQPAAPPPPAPKQKPALRPARPAPEKKAPKRDPDIETGDVVDPFASP